MKLKQLAVKLSKYTLLTKGYYILAVLDPDSQDSFTFAAGWNSDSAYTEDVLLSRINKPFPVTVRNDLKTFNNRHASVHNSIKNLLSESIYGFIFNSDNPDLELLIYEYNDSQCNQLNQVIHLTSQLNCQEFYNTIVVTN